MKTIKENNRIIAEFMGVHEIMLDEYSNYDLEDIYKILGIRKSLVGVIHESDLQFNSSWDWLMPVVERIESYGFDVRVRKDDCVIYYNSDKSDERILYVEHPKGKLRSTYEAVVEFIKWYNKNK